MKDIDKMSKAELKKLIKKEKKKAKKKTRTKKHATTKQHAPYEQHTNKNMSDRMIEQKPIIARTNPLQQVQQYMPPGFGGLASIDQRNNDILRGQVNETSNKLISIERRHRNENEIFDIRLHDQELEHNRKLDKIKNSGELKRQKQEQIDARKASKAQQSPLSNIVSSSMNRESHPEPNFFKLDDGYDAVTTSGTLHDPLGENEPVGNEQEGQESNEQKEEYESMDVEPNEDSKVLREKARAEKLEWVYTLNLEEMNQMAAKWGLQIGKRKEKGMRKMLVAHVENEK